MIEVKFDAQRFATPYVRDAEETKYSGRRRLAGNYGRLWIGPYLIFDVKSFEAKITADREDVIIGVSKDSKIVSLTGEGEFTVNYVYDVGYTVLMQDWQKGFDTRLTFIGEIWDPDAIGGGKERVRLKNVWFNEYTIMNFEKGAIIERTIPFGFTPSDVTFESVITKTDEGTQI